MSTVADKIDRVLAAAEKAAGPKAYRIQEIKMHVNGYAEPGYDDADIVLTGNWNPISGDFKDKRDPMKRLVRILERLGVEMEWSDEWTACSECSKLVRVSPNSYSWQPSYAFVRDELLCHECVQDDPESYLETLKGNPRAALTLDIDPEDYGYQRVNEESYESGFHAGQTDDPAKIAASLRAQGIERFLFRVDDVGQFDMRFSVYVREGEVTK